MDPDRRQSLRISNRLPFAWQTFSREPSETQLRQAFGTRSWPHQRLREVSEGIRLTMPMLPGETRDVVRLLEEKIDLLVDQFAYPEPKEICDINLSHEGLDFSSSNADAITADSHLGIHLALPCGNLICAAKVTQCSGERVGAELKLNVAQARLLSRYLLIQPS